MECMEPSPADVVCRALEKRLGTSMGSGWRASLVYAKISPGKRKEGGFCQPVRARQAHWARECWLC